MDEKMKSDQAYMCALRGKCEKKDQIRYRWKSKKLGQGGISEGND
jgi:hypothetical protein